MAEIAKREMVPAPAPVTTSEERTWAAIAHATTVVTVLFGLPTAGLTGLLLVFVPLLIYLAFKDKSRFIAFHAAQAFALQIALTVGLFVATLAGALVIALAWVITTVLIFILVGLILIPVAILITLVVTLVLVGLPFVAAGFSIIATIETASGHDYRYPYVGVWVEDWLARHTSEATPAV